MPESPLTVFHPYDDLSTEILHQYPRQEVSKFNETVDAVNIEQLDNSAKELFLNFLTSYCKHELQDIKSQSRLVVHLNDAVQNLEDGKNSSYFIGEHKFVPESSVSQSVPENDADSLLDKGNSFMLCKNFEKAAEVFEEAIVMNPKSRKAMVKKGLALCELNRDEEGMECMDRAIAIDGNFKDALYLKGVILCKLNRDEEGMECLDRAIAIDGNFKDALYLKGAILCKLNRDEEGMECLDRAMALEGDDKVALCKKGVALCKLNRKEEGMECLDRAIAIDGNFKDALYLKGVILFELNRKEEGMECLDRAMALEGDDKVSLFNKGVALCKLNRKDEAIPCFDRAIAIDGNFIEAWNYMGLALRDLGRNEEAIKCFEQSIAMNPLDLFSWCHIGEILLDLYRENEARVCLHRCIEEADRVLDISKTDEKAYQMKGRALSLLERYEEAISCLHESSHFCSDSSFLVSWYQGDCLRCLGKFEEAMDCYDRSIFVNPRSEFAWNGKAITLFQLTRLEEALECIEKSIDINPHLDRFWTLKATILNALHRKEESLDCLVRATTMNPRNVKAWKLKASILEDLHRMSDRIECLKLSQDVFGSEYATFFQEESDSSFLRLNPNSWNQSSSRRPFLRVTAEASLPDIQGVNQLSMFAIEPDVLVVTNSRVVYEDAKMQYLEHRLFRVNADGDQSQSSKDSRSSNGSLAEMIQLEILEGERQVSCMFSESMDMFQTVQSSILPPSSVQEGVLVLLESTSEDVSVFPLTTTSFVPFMWESYFSIRIEPVDVGCTSEVQTFQTLMASFPRGCIVRAPRRVCVDIACQVTMIPGRGILSHLRSTIPCPRLEMEWVPRTSLLTPLQCNVFLQPDASPQIEENIIWIMDKIAVETHFIRTKLLGYSPVSIPVDADIVVFLSRNLGVEPSVRSEVGLRLFVNIALPFTEESDLLLEEVENSIGLEEEELHVYRPFRDGEINTFNSAPLPYYNTKGEYLHDTISQFREKWNRSGCWKWIRDHYVSNAVSKNVEHVEAISHLSVDDVDIWTFFTLNQFWWPVSSPRLPSTIEGYATSLIPVFSRFSFCMGGASSKQETSDCLRPCPVIVDDPYPEFASHASLSGYFLVEDENNYTNVYFLSTGHCSKSFVDDPSKRENVQKGDTVMVYSSPAKTGHAVNTQFETVRVGDSIWVDELQFSVDYSLLHCSVGNKEPLPHLQFFPHMNDAGVATYSDFETLMQMGRTSKQRDETHISLFEKFNASLKKACFLVNQDTLFRNGKLRRTVDHEVEHPFFQPRLFFNVFRIGNLPKSGGIDFNSGMSGGLVFKGETMTMEKLLGILVGASSNGSYGIACPMFAVAEDLRLEGNNLFCIEG